MKPITISIEEYQYLLGCKNRAETLRAAQARYRKTLKGKASNKAYRERRKDK